jgi:hypothetical protein
MFVKEMGITTKTARNLQKLSDMPTDVIFSLCQEEAMAVLHHYAKKAIRNYYNPRYANIHIENTASERLIQDALTLTEKGVRLNEY